MLVKVVPFAAAASWFEICVSKSTIVSLESGVNVL
jgi:hypothetical protein